MEFPRRRWSRETPAMSAFWGLPGSSVPLPSAEYTSYDNTLFAVARAEMLAGTFKWLTQPFYIVGCSVSYTDGLETLSGWGAVPQATVLFSASLHTTGIDGGYAAADDVSLAGITTLVDIASVLLIRRGDPAAAPDIPVLLFRRLYGMPKRLNNEDFVLRWDRSFGGMFRA